MTSTPLFWHQGLFLQPQHLQLADAHNRSLIGPVLQFGAPYLFGAHKPVLRDSALEQKNVEVESGEFVFQDGTHVVYPGNASVEIRSFEEAWVEGDKPFTVYLGLRRFAPTEKNVTVVPDTADAISPDTRYLARTSPDPVPDLHSDGPQAQVRPLTHNLRIFWETELDQARQYNLMPLTRLVQTSEGVARDPEFVPPSLTLESSQRLMNLIREVRDHALTRCRRLEEYKSPKSMATMEVDTGFLIFFMALRTVNRYAPLLKELTEGRPVPPWAAYSLLRQFIGEMSSFSDSINALGEDMHTGETLPAYDHMDPLPRFLKAQDMLARLLDGISAGPEHIIRLDPEPPYYTGAMPDKVFEEKNRFWLVLRTETEKAELLKAMERVIKLSSKQEMGTLIARAVPGIPLERFETPPPGLPRRSDAHYFRIDTDNPFWEQIRATSTATLFWEGAPKDLVAEIVVLRS